MSASLLLNAELVKNAIEDGLIATPGGFRAKSFVHLVQQGEAVVKRGGVSHVLDVDTMKLVGLPKSGLAARNPADQSGGWVTWASWSNKTGTAISSFSTSWEVPPAPASASDQLIYLFNGLQDPNGNEILQPVLQWGQSGAGGGANWSVASWHVDSNNHAFCTPSVPVNPGDVLTGVMTLTATYEDGTRNYSSEFLGIPGTKLMALGIVELTDAEETLEVYGLTDPSEYPNAPNTAMKQINLQTGGNAAPVQWAANSMAAPQFGEHTEIVTDGGVGGETDLYY